MPKPIDVAQLLAIDSEHMIVILAEHPDRYLQE